MSNFENLKKQAKQILRWHRDRYYPVAAQIRAVLPRFQHLRDPEILAASFKLTDAQELVARQSGFDSWQALRAGVATMTKLSSQMTARPILTAAEPQLFTSDIDAACEFFIQKLGFALVFKYGEPPFYAQVVRDAARLNLRHVDRPAIDPALRDHETLLSAALTVATADEIKQLYLDFQAAGIAFAQPLRKQPWGARNFIVRDPDGNLLLFVGPAD